MCKPALSGSSAKAMLFFFVVLVPKYKSTTVDGCLLRTGCPLGDQPAFSIFATLNNSKPVDLLWQNALTPLIHYLVLCGVQAGYYLNRYIRVSFSNIKLSLINTVILSLQQLTQPLSNFNIVQKHRSRPRHLKPTQVTCVRRMSWHAINSINSSKHDLFLYLVGIRRCKWRHRSLNCEPRSIVPGYTEHQSASS